MEQAIATVNLCIKHKFALVPLATSVVADEVGDDAADQPATEEDKFTDIVKDFKHNLISILLHTCTTRSRAECQ